MVTIRLFIYKLKNSHAYKDENISFHKYINSWTLQIYWDISRNIDENFNKKNSYDKNWSKFIKILGNTQNDRTNNNILIYEEINIWVI